MITQIDRLHLYQEAIGWCVEHGATVEFYSRGTYECRVEWYRKTGAQEWTYGETFVEAVEKARQKHNA